jgi:hypothetical protein
VTRHEEETIKMKTCIEKKTVSREDGSTYERCARYEDTDVDLVPAGDNDMGRRRRHRSMRGLGAIMAEPLKGLTSVSMDDFVGPGVGLAGMIAGTLLAKKYGSKINSLVVDWAPLAGGVFGALCSVPLYYVKGKKAMLSGVITSLLFGAAATVLDRMGAFGNVYLGSRFPFGLVSAQRVGALPAMHETTSMPSGVQYQMDPSAWGQTS